MNTSPKSNSKDTLISCKKPNDAFIDNIIEGEESIIQDVNKVLPTSLLLQREFETRDLSAINLMRFQGDSEHWPNFIQNFKHRVHNKITACSYHVTYAFQSESTLYSCLNVKELLARSRREIWSLSDCNWTRTLNHLATLAIFWPFALKCFNFLITVIPGYSPSFKIIFNTTKPIGEFRVSFMGSRQIWASIDKPDHSHILQFLNVYLNAYYIIDSGRLWNPTCQCTSLFRLAIIHLRESPESSTTSVKHNCASLCNIVKEQNTDLIFQWDTGINIRLSSSLASTWTNRIYMHKSRYAKHGLGYCDLLYYEWQRHNHRNPTKKYRLKSHNLTSLLKVT